jgi:hypothetical protein
MINTINIGLNIFEKLPEDIQLFTHTYYPLITNRIIQRNLVKYNIPNEILHLILTYLNIDYTFDQDMVYFYFEPVVFLVDNKLQVSVYSWYGCHIPDNYNPGILLHNIFERPYSIILERNLGRIAYAMYQNIKHFNLREDIINGLFEFTGTYGPIKDGLESKGSIHYNKISNASWHFSTPNILEYFKEMNVINADIDNLTSELTEESINNLKNIICETIKDSMSSFMRSSKNKINGPFVKKNEEVIGINNKKLFYSICKNKSNEQVIIEKNMLRQIIVH